MSDTATLKKLLKQIDKPANPIYGAVAALHLIKHVEIAEGREEFCLLGCMKHTICIARTATWKLGVMTQGKYRWTDKT